MRSIILMVIVGLLAFPMPAQSQDAQFSVIIFVVDDFEGTPAAEIREAVDPSEDECNCEREEFVPEGELCYVDLGQAGEQGVAMAGGMSGGQLATDQMMAHGELVSGLVNELIATYNIGYDITMVPVSVEGFTATRIAENIIEAIDDNPADYYVLNMSFALIPCEDYADLEQFEAALTSANAANDWLQLRDTLADLSNYYDSVVVPALNNSLAGSGECVPSALSLDEAQILEAIAAYSGCSPIQVLVYAFQNNLVPVASAGNFGLSFPSWPAAWPGVVSASAGPESVGFASMTRNLDQRIPSSSGEIILPGLWHYDPTSPRGFVMGTSYAAPRLSFAIALYLADGAASKCFGSNGFGLAYATLAGPWLDLSLLEAAQQFCPEFINSAAFGVLVS